MFICATGLCKCVHAITIACLARHSSDIYFAFPADAPAKAATAARYSAAAWKEGLLGEEAEAKAGSSHGPQQKAWAELEESGLAYVNTVPVLIGSKSHWQGGTGIYSWCCNMLYFLLL